ncbi:MAG TPA: HAMP domain-containing sensor histidine kinase [Candidatus Sulfotelmatobacter sp.]|jgi:signal transduction histidine kinase|nr:HAMP domain-containing sensor histidine kinase [Candidatus Sulfotelmatobacter sp.]
MHVISKTTQLSPVIRLIIFVGLNMATGVVADISLSYLPQFNPFLIFIPTIVFCTWYGGFIVGLITTIFSVVSVILMLFYPTSHPLLLANTTFIIEILIFFFVSAFISYVIHVSKKQDKITEYQKKLRQTHHVIETLEKYYDSSQTEIEARDQFLAIASHELKTPVTSMLLQVQTAIHNIRNVSLANFSVASLLKMLESTEQQSKRLSKMVNDLLDLSLITTGKIDLEIEETNISTIVQDVAEKFTVRLTNKNQLSIITNKTVICHCDKVRIEQAVVNLVSNAIKYGNNKPITIAISNSHEHIHITVKDQGIGIPPDQQKRIFNRFERAVSSRDYKGLGVGLYITYQIIKAHKGKVLLHSQLNKGSAFTIELPLKPSQK